MPAPLVRLLTAADAEAARALGAEAFGYPVRTDAVHPDWPGAGTVAVGAFLDGRLVAHARAEQVGSWFGGRRVPTSAVASVAVAPEHRGAGLLAPVLTGLLDQARAAGAVVSTLYPTAPGVYRGAGFELVGELVDVEVPIAALDRVRPAPGVTVSRFDRGATEIRDLYDAWAARRNGPLHRPRDRGFAGRHEHVSLARDAEGQPVGYLRWRNDDGYDPTRSVVSVRELIALTPAAADALWRLLAGFGSAAAHLRLRTSWPDPARLALPAAAFRPVAQWPYALAVLDVAGAFAARGVAPLVSTLPFTVVDGPRVESYELRADGAGGAQCAPADPGGCSFTTRGLAMVWSGAHSCADVRAAGHLTGPDSDDAGWDALLHRGPVSIRDYF